MALPSSSPRARPAAPRRLPDPGDRPSFRAEQLCACAHNCSSPTAESTQALGLEQDLSARGMGIRSQRYAMVVDDGVVKTLNLDAPGKFEVSDAGSILATLS